MKEILNKIIEEIGIDENLDNNVEEEFLDNDDDVESKMEGDWYEDEVIFDEVESDFGNEECKIEGESLEEDEVRFDEVENYFKNDKCKIKGDL